MSYWAMKNWQVVYADEHTFALTLTDEDGDPVDVSAYVSYYVAESDFTTDTVSLTSAAGDITYTDSGTGTTDTINVTMAETDTDITLGTYDHHLVAVIAGATTTLLLGKLTVVNNAAEIA